MKASLTLMVCALAAVMMPQLACRSHATPSDQHYELKGTVVSVNRQAATITIAHEAVAGYLEAMVTQFKLNEDRLSDNLQEGDRVHATLVVAGTRSWLENVVTEASAGSSNLSQPNHGSNKPEAAQEVDKEKLHHGVGTVDSIDREHATVQLDHEDIKDVMPAMNMPYAVKDKALLDSIIPGDKVDFWLESTDAGLIIVEIKKR